MPPTRQHFDAQIAHISDEDLFAALHIAPKSFVDGIFGFHLRSGGLFRDADDLLATRAQAAQSFEPQRDQILTAAERILRHDIQGWGDVSVQHGLVVDFNAGYGKNGKYGFHYWVWAHPLIHSYLLTEDQKYLDEFDALFNSWYAQRDQIRGDIETLDVIYYELGLGLRVRTFLEFLQLSRPSNSSYPSHLKLLKTLLGSARWLVTCESESYRPGNWQIMGCTGLAWIAALLPEFHESDAWAQIAADRLSEHVQRDLYADGCHYERVPSSYMLTVYKDIRNVATLLHREDLLLGAERMLQWYRHILPPDGMIPAINDGPRVPMPLQVLEEARKKSPEAGKDSAHLPVSGFTVLRGGNLYMLINHGPMAGGHTHRDALSFEMHSHGAPMAIDSGIGKTYDDPLHEKWYITPAAHNMLEVVGAELDRAATEGSDVFFFQSPLLEYFAATHHGYEKSAGLLHRRHVIFVRGLYFLIVDEIHATRAADLAWHLHTPLKMRQTLNGFVADAPAFSILTPSPCTPAGGQQSRTGEDGGVGKVERGTGDKAARSKGKMLSRQPEILHPSSFSLHPSAFRSAPHPNPPPEYQGRELVWRPFQSSAPASVAGIPGYHEYADIDWLQFQCRVPTGAHRAAVLLAPGDNLRLTQLPDDHWTIDHPLGSDHILLPPTAALQASEDFSFQGRCAMWRIHHNQVTQWAVAGATLFWVDEKTLHQSGSPINASGEIK